MKLSKIFEEPIYFFGLHGDPYLWEDFKERMVKYALIQNVEEFKKKIYETFEDLTGVSIDYKSFVYINRYNRGGFTSGMIAPCIWRQRVIPMLLLRFQGLG